MTTRETGEEGRAGERGLAAAEEGATDEPAGKGLLMLVVRGRPSQPSPRTGF